MVGDINIWSFHKACIYDIFLKTLTFDLLTLLLIGVIYWPWPIFLPRRMTVSHNLFKILSRHGFCIKCYCDLDLWPTDLKMYRGHLLTMTNLSTKYHDCHLELNKIMSGHDVANRRTDRQTDGRHTILRPKFHFGRIKTSNFNRIWTTDT